MSNQPVDRKKPTSHLPKMNSNLTTVTFAYLRKLSTLLTNDIGSQFRQQVFAGLQRLTKRREQRGERLNKKLFFHDFDILA
jgi:hypothetical protein